jgi:hypothetical protein
MVSGNSGTGQFQKALFKVRVGIVVRHIGVRCAGHCGCEATQCLGQAQAFATIGRDLRRIQHAVYYRSHIGVVVGTALSQDWIIAHWHGNIYLVNT